MTVFFDTNGIHLGLKIMLVRIVSGVSMRCHRFIFLSVKPLPNLIDLFSHRSISETARRANPIHIQLVANRIDSTMQFCMPSLVQINAIFEAMETYWSEIDRDWFRPIGEADRSRSANSSSCRCQGMIIKISIVPVAYIIKWLSTIIYIGFVRVTCGWTISLLRLHRIAISRSVNGAYCASWSNLFAVALQEIEKSQPGECGNLWCGVRSGGTKFAIASSEFVYVQRAHLQQHLYPYESERVTIFSQQLECRWWSIWIFESE